MEASDPAGAQAAPPPRIHWMTELRLAAVLLAFGMFVVPLGVYAVGLHVFGDYESETGPAGLLGAVWLDLAAGHPPAWILVLSPYVVVQLSRLARAVWRWA